MNKAISLLLLAASLIIGSNPAFAVNDCNDAEPICDYPLVPVCVQQTTGQGGWQGQVRSIWTCQDKTQTGAVKAKVFAKGKPVAEEVHSDLGFFPNDFAQRVQNDSKDESQRTNELFGGH